MPDPAGRARRPHALWLWLALPLLASLCTLEGARSPEPARPISARDPAAATLLFGGRFDPNRASPSDLELLPGIGPTRAAAIAEHAKAHPFRRPADLARVGGIGPKTVEKLRPWLEIQSVVADSHSTAQAPVGTPSAPPGDAIGGKELSADGRTGRRTD